MSTYQDTLDYLYAKLPMYNRIGAAAIKNNLDNTLAICEYLGNPEKKYPSIHIAGTNGKGSSSHMLASIFQAAGYKTGLYTSPHLYDFRERIKVNGQMCPERFVTEFTNKVKPIIEKIEPSFFEITVGMAFEYFAQEQCDIAIIETGLGGRLDSTNVIQPILSLITNIGWDHMALLGNTLPAIATEKAGIIKKDTPIVISEVIDETKSVFEQTASKLDAPIYFAEDFLQFKSFTNHWTTAHFEYDQISVDCDLPGKYQYKNIRGVLQSIHLLKSMGWKLDEASIQKGLTQIKSSTGLMGRWECLQESPKLFIDVAHNEHGMHALLEQLATLEYQQLHIITGMVKDKDVDAVLGLLPKDAQFYFSNAHIQRAMPAIEVAAKAKAIGISGSVFENVNEAIIAANKNAHPNDLIIVMGSIFLVAEVNR
jgi:dihydrofolate synthase / folylpolyglutamate synthase